MRRLGEACSWKFVAFFLRGCVCGKEILGLLIKLWGNSFCDNIENALTKLPIFVIGYQEAFRHESIMVFNKHSTKAFYLLSTKLFIKVSIKSF